MATEAPDQDQNQAAAPPELEIQSLAISSSPSSSSSSSNPTNQMSLEQRYQIVRSIGEECIQEDELRNLLEKKPEPICYDGFEPSGRMHIAQGVMKTINVNKLTSAGCRVKIWIADWCGQIMGRSDEEELTAAQIFYPCMQCADVFFLKADICQLGMDQRKVNVLAREYCDVIKRKNKPIILSHHMLPGLQQGQEKMSKSDPLSSIFMEDDEAEVNLKIKRAYCPPDIVEGNPCLEYVKYLILPWFKKFLIERSAENGGDKSFENFEELVAYYESGKLHPADLKPALAKALNKILEPVREHFKNDNNAKDLLKRVKVWSIDF
ncbi:tyrosine--trna ligase 1 [Quercus suber]|uniref:tyrosine--tRNA ligase n=2 Tax=Quercus suber TaxID=58331 RepID=A0AAW0IMF3_QUESU